MASDNPFAQFAPAQAPQEPPAPSAPPSAQPDANPFAQFAPRQRSNRFDDPYWDDVASQAADKHGIPRELMLAIKNRGEMSNADQVSPKGARTVFQIMPATRDLFLKKYGVDAFSSDEAAAEVSALHLKESLQRGRSPVEAAAEYNAGPDQRNWNNPETQGYIQRIQAALGGEDQHELKRMGGRPAPQRQPLRYNPTRPPADEVDLSPEALAQRNPSYSPTESLAKGVKGLKLTWDFLADRLGRTVTGGDTSATPILEQSVREFSQMASDPRLKTLVELGDKAYEDRGAVAALYDIGKYVLQNPGVVASLLTEQIPGMIAGGPVGRGVGMAAGRAAAAAGAGRAGVERAVTGGFGAGISGSQTVLQGLGAEYAEGINKGMDPETAADRAIRKTMVEAGPNALAGAFLWLNPFRSALANAAGQVGIQGTGGAAGSAAGSLSVGETPSFTEGVLEFVGEGAFAPIEYGMSRLGGRPEPTAPGSATPPASPAPDQAPPSAPTAPQSDVATRIANMRRRVEANEAFLTGEASDRLDAFRSRLGADQPFAGLETGQDTAGVRTPIDTAIAIDQGEKQDSARARIGADRPYAGLESAEDGRAETPIDEFMRAAAAERGRAAPISRGEVDALLDERAEQQARQRAQDESNLAQVARETRSEESAIARPGFPENTAMADALAARGTRQGAAPQPAARGAQPQSRPGERIPPFLAKRFERATDEQIEMAARAGSGQVRRFAKMELDRRRATNPEQRRSSPVPERPATDTADDATALETGSNAGVTPSQGVAAPEDQPRVAVPRQSKASRYAVDQSKDDLLSAIAKLGGLDRAEAVGTWGLDLPSIPQSKVFGKPILRKNKGRSLDDMAEALHESGYLSARDLAEFERKFDDAIRGKRVMTAQGMESDLEQMVDRGDFGPDETGVEFDRDMADAEEQAALALLGEESIEEIKERSALQSEGQGEASYLQALYRNLREAINEAENQVERADAAPAGQATRSDRDDAARSAQGGEEETRPTLELAATTPEQLRGEAALAERQAEERRRRENAPPADEFTLTGSSRPADEARARDQMELMDQPSFGFNRPEPAPADDRRTEARGLDRRQDAARRKSVAEMSPDEMRRELLTNPVTGLPNKRAYEEAEKKPAQASIDVDSLAWVNDNLGHSSGDEMLRAVAESMRIEGVEVYHVSGDEFVAQGESDQAVREQLDRVRQRLSNAVIEGDDWIYKGLGVSYGIAPTYAEADSRLFEDKRAREAAGTRAARKETPPSARRRNEPDREGDAAEERGGDTQAGDDGQVAPALAEGAGDGRGVGGERSAEAGQDGGGRDAAVEADRGDDGGVETAPITEQVAEAAKSEIDRRTGKSDQTPAATISSGARSKPGRIADFGEKIGGARKDVWSSFKDQLGEVADGGIESQPLSKIWPQPDYQALLDSGADPWAVAFARSARDEIPAKPRQSWKVRRWVDQARFLRATTLHLMDGSLSVDRARGMLSDLESRDMRDLAGRIELYMLVGHRQSLDGVRISSGSYSMHNGVEYKPAKVIWTVEKTAAASAFSNWPRQLAEGFTKEEALKAFKERYDQIDISPGAKKETSFEIYSRGDKDGYWVGKKIGRNPLFLAGPFDSIKAARDHKANNQAELVAKLEKAKEIPRERRDVNEPRVGEDMRNGQDVTPQMFGETFGFRGVEFGNWVEQGRRQKDLNDAFDAMMDMAAVIGVSPKALSLNGELGLAFGARGSGGRDSAAAHYERGKVVINLTKKSGSGNLGHEWWHALDNYFSRSRAKGDGFMTEALDVSQASRGAAFQHAGAVRKEMIEAFGVVMKSIRSTAMKARSAKLDAKRSKEYWTTGPEMAARAFESYLISKLQDQGASNDYLANIVDPETWTAAESLGFELGDSYPYPTAGEIPAIRAGFDQFFQTIDSRETDKGVALFSRGQSVGDGMPRSAAQAEVDRLAKTWANGPKIVVVDTASDLPFDAPADARGAFHRGTAYVVAANNATEADVQFTLWHEALGHYGLRGSLGSDLGRAMLSIAEQNANIREAAAAWRKANPQGNLSSSGWQIASIEEAMSDLAASGKTFNGLRKFVAAVQRALRAVGLDRVADWLESATDAQALSILADARQFVESGPHVYGDALAAKWSRTEDGGQSPKFSRITGTVNDALEVIRSPGTVQGAIKQMGALLESNGKFGMLSKTLQTQYHKATKDKHFARVFNVLLQQNQDTQHYAIESEEQAPDLLLPMKNFGDIKKALASAFGGKYRRDIEAIAKPLFANIAGKRGVQQKVFTDAELRKDFGLTDRQIELYRQYRAAVDQSLERLGQTLLMRVGRSTGIMTAQYKNQSLEDTYTEMIGDLNLRRQALIDSKGKRPLSKSIAVDEAGRFSQSMVPEGRSDESLDNQIESLDTAIAELREINDKVRGLIASGYTPAMRFGRYAVTAYSANAAETEPEYFALYETASEANLAAAKLAKANPSWQIQKGQISEHMHELFRDVSPEMAEMFGRFMGMENNEAFKQYVALASASRSALKRQLDRQGTAGFSEDALRVLASFVTSNARKSAADIHAGEVAEAMQAIPKEKGDVIDEATKLVTYLRNPREEAGALRGLLFAQFMGGSVAAAAVNLTQPVLMTAPYLSQFIGAGKLLGAMRGAVKIGLGGKAGNMELDNAMRRAAEDGLTEPQEIYQLQAEASGSAFGRSIVGRAFSKAWGGFFSLSESLNRRITFAAAYQVAQEMGRQKLAEKGFNSAYEFAKKAVFETQGIYCVDTDTEILTAAGWKTVHDLSAGELVYATDKSGRLIETPLLNVHFFPGLHQALHFRNRHGLSMVLTSDHTCVVQNYSSRDQKWQRIRKVKAKEIKPHHFFVRVPMGDALVRDEFYSDDEVRLFAWVASEGHLFAHRNCVEKRGVGIVQSESHNPEYVAEIDALLDRLGGHYNRKISRSDRMVCWQLRKPLWLKVHEALPDKQITNSFVRKLTSRQMAIFLETFAKGDGHFPEGGGVSISQKDLMNLDCLQAMAVLSGQSSTLYRRLGSRDFGCLYVAKNSVRAHAKQMIATPVEVVNVWCPETEHGTWIARRNGRTFVTGNSKVNRPNWARGPVGSTVFTFKQFSIAWLEWFSRLPKQQQVLALAMLTLAAGVEGLPFAEDIEDLLDTIGQKMGYATNTKKQLRELAASALGKDWAEFALHGTSAIPGMPLDVSARLGLQNLIPGTRLFNPSAKDKEKEALEVLGAVGSLGKSAISAVSSGKPSELLPKAVKDVYKAIEIATTGEYRDTRGRKVENADMVDAFVKAIGFQPAHIAARQRATNEVQRDIDIVKRVEAEISDDWARSVVDGKRDGVEAAKQRLRDWNESNKDSPIKIEPNQIARRIKELRATKEERQLKAAPREMRQRLAEAL